MSKITWNERMNEMWEEAYLEEGFYEDPILTINCENEDKLKTFLNQFFGDSLKEYDFKNFSFHWNEMCIQINPLQQPCCEEEIVWNVLFPLETLKKEGFDASEAWIVINNADLQLNEVPNFHFGDNLEDWFLTAESLFQWSLDQYRKPGLNLDNQPMHHWENKRDIVRKKIIPVYTTIAAGIAAVPIPFSDAMLLIPCQTTMGLHILKAYDLESISSVVSGIISSTVVSQLGRSAAANLIKMIPIVGSITGALINSGVASSFTWVLGMALSEIAYSFKKARLEGKEPDLEEFFSQVNLCNIMRGVDPSDYDDSY